MNIEFLGGVGEVGRSCTKIQKGGSIVLVDCGLKHGEEPSYPELDKLGKVDSVVLTHAHIDHTGALPILANRGLLEEDANIFCTPPTAALLHVLLWDSYKLQRAGWEARGKAHLYEHKDVNEVLNRLFTVPFQTFEPVKGIKAHFGYSGHVLGSAWVRVEAGGKSFLFTGDLGEGRSLHLEKAASPPHSDVLITESTYGATNQHSSFSDVCKNISDFLDFDGPILIPVFSIGRSIEIFQLLRRYGANGEEVWYDGMIGEVLPVYRSYACDAYVCSSLTNLIKNSGNPKPFLPVGASAPQSIWDRRRLARKENPIIISPSGMLTGGWSPFYLHQMAEYRDSARVILVGYQAEGTVGRKLIDEKEKGSSVATVNVSTFDYPEKNESFDDRKPGFVSKTIDVPLDWVYSQDGLSAHSSANHLLEFAREVAPRKIFAVHGDIYNSNSLLDLFENDSSLKHIDAEIPEVGKKIEIEEEIPKSFEDRLKDLEERVSDLESNC